MGQRIFLAHFVCQGGNCACSKTRRNRLRSRAAGFLLLWGRFLGRRYKGGAHVRCAGEGYRQRLEVAPFGLLLLLGRHVRRAHGSCRRVRVCKHGLFRGKATFDHRCRRGGGDAFGPSRQQGVFSRVGVYRGHRPVGGVSFVLSCILFGRFLGCLGRNRIGAGRSFAGCVFRDVAKLLCVRRHLSHHGLYPSFCAVLGCAVHRHWLLADGMARGLRRHRLARAWRLDAAQKPC